MITISFHTMECHETKILLQVEYNINTTRLFKIWADEFIHLHKCEKIKHTLSFCWTSVCPPVHVKHKTDLQELVHIIMTCKWPKLHVHLTRVTSDNVFF